MERKQWRSWVYLSNVRVRKEDGSIESFDKDKIIQSIRKETGCTGQVIEDIVDEVYNTLKVIKLDPITGPLIREFVNTKFLEYDMNDCRRRYTRVGMPVYDARMADLGGGKGDNANLGNSPETVHKRKADQLSKEEAMLLLPEHLANSHLSGDIHIGDLEYITSRRFCADYDLRFIFYYGFAGDGAGVHTSVAGPAMRHEVALLHAVKTLCSGQTQKSGGQGFYAFLTFISPYFKNVSYKEIKQSMQLFIFEMTQNLVARGSQVCFSSVQLSPSVPSLWKDKPAVYKGKVGPETYGDFEKEHRLLFQAFIEVMLEGDYAGKPFYFPKPEIAIEPEYIELMEREKNNVPEDMPSIEVLYLKAFELASKFGSPYFDNMLPAYRGAGKGISCVQCCSYNFSSGPDADPNFNDKLYFKDGKHFTMGSSQVITLNIPRCAYESFGDYDKFIQLCKEKIDIAIEVFKIKDKWMDECVAFNMFPFATQRQVDKNTGKLSPPLLDYDDYAYSIGVIGLNEVCEILLGKQLHEDNESHRFILKICNDLNKYCQSMSKLHGMKLALSRTPAETTAQRFAVLDLLNYGNAHKHVKGNIKEAIRIYAETGSRDLPIYYTNGTHCPVDASITMAEKVRIEQAFFPILDGGNICHIFLGEKAPDPRGLMDMTMKICKSTNLGYFAFTRDFTVCNSNLRLYTGE